MTNIYYYYVYTTIEQVFRIIFSTNKCESIVAFVWSPYIFQLVIAIFSMPYNWSEDTLHSSITDWMVQFASLYSFSLGQFEWIFSSRHSARLWELMRHMVVDSSLISSASGLCKTGRTYLFAGIERWEMKGICSYPWTDDVWWMWDDLPSFTHVAMSRGERYGLEFNDFTANFSFANPSAAVLMLVSLK